MGIPAAVQRQADMADEILRKINEPAAAASEPPAAVTPPEPANADTPPVDQQPGATEAPAAATTDGSPAANAQGSDGQPKRVDWKHKYLVLEGKYRAEVPRLHAEKRALTEQVSRLNGTVTKLNGEIEQLRAAGITPPSDDGSFDPDLIARIREVSRDAAKGVVDERVAPIEQRVSSSEHDAAINARVEFENNVDDLLLESHGTSWREHDEKPEFHEFLRGVDRLSGRTRQELLNDAVAKADATRAAAMFQDFLDATKAPTQHAPTPPPARTPPADDPRQRLVVPDRAAAGAKAPTPEARTYTRTEVSKFYASYAREQVDRKTTPTRRAELEAMDADIQLAMREGRIR